MNHQASAAVLAVLLAWTATAAPRPRTNALDRIFHNGRIIVVDPPSVIAQAFAVSGDRFVAVGRRPGRPRSLERGRGWST